MTVSFLMAAFLSGRGLSFPTRTPAAQIYGRGRAGRLFRLLVRLPVPLFGLVAGREWYAEPGAESARPIGDVLQPAPQSEN
jgi:hypothetical protein